MIRACKKFSELAVLMLVVLVWASTASAQSPVVAVGSASGTVGTAVNLPVNFTTGATGVSSLQFDLTLPSGVTSPNSPSVTTGSAALAAGKSASASVLPSGAVRVLIFGLNQNVIGNGGLAIVNLNIAAGTAPGTLTVGISGIVASDAGGNAVATTGTNGSVVVTVPVDTTAPTISGVGSSGVTYNAAAISWTTNEASDTQVDYGTTTAYGSSTILNSSMVTSHSASLSGLTASTTYHYRVKSKDAAGNLATSGDFTFTTREASGTTSTDLFVPIVLSAAGLQGSFFTSEMTITNRGSSNATLDLTYTSAFGGGSGVAIDYLGAGQQRIIPDTISYLRNLGIPIPATGNRGGTLGVRFSGITSPSDGAVMLRTTTAVPNGRAGLAYAGIPRESALKGASYICGLRQNSTDRSNLALQNVGFSGEGEITLKLTVFSGDSSASLSQRLPDVILPPGGFQQISGILTSNGLSLANGFVRIEKIAGSAPFYVYGVINDQSNSDGSFIPPILESSLQGRTRLTLPVIVEANAFSSELVVTNWSGDTKTLRCSFVSDGIDTADSTARFDIELKPKQQIILTDLVQRLRDSGHTEIGPKGATFAGPLIAEVASGDLSGISLAARTSAPGGGGRYGLFYPAVPNGMAVTNSAWIFGLQQNRENRSNLALVNTGEVDASDDVFAIELYDGETGMKIATLEGIAVKAGRWKQIGAILVPYGPTTTHGYARITRTVGSNPFIAYGVINDGSKPGERSDDGAFIMMESDSQ